MKYIRVRLENLLRVKRIVTCFTEEHAADFCAEVESHDFWEMVYLRRGGMLYRAGETGGSMSAGEVIFHAPNVPHALCGDGKHPFSFFIVSFVCDSPAMQTLAGKRIRLPASLTGLIENIIQEKKASFLADRQTPLVGRADAPLGGQQLIGLYLEQLFIGILREAAKHEPTGLYTSRSELEAGLAADMRAYLEAHLYDAVDMKTLCDHFHYGKSRLSAVFRNAYGDSVMHWYLARKIKAAQQAILNGESIAEISARLQFDSPQYFSRIFKRYTGVCPRDFRAQSAWGT